MFLLDLERVAKDQDLSFQEVRVLLFLISKVGMQNQIIIEQKTIATELQMHHTNVSKIMRRLREKGFIEKSMKRGPVYRLSPNVGWRGTGKDWKLEQDKRVIEKKAMA